MCWDKVWPNCVNLASVSVAFCCCVAWSCVMAVSMAWILLCCCWNISCMGPSGCRCDASWGAFAVAAVIKVASFDTAGVCGFCFIHGSMYGSPVLKTEIVLSLRSCLEGGFGLGPAAMADVAAAGLLTTCWVSIGWELNIIMIGGGFSLQINHCLAPTGLSGFVVQS